MCIDLKNIVILLPMYMKYIQVCSSDITLILQPEYIDPMKDKGQGFSVRADVWSLGLTLVCILRFQCLYIILYAQLP